MMALRKKQVTILAASFMVALAGPLFFQQFGCKQQAAEREKAVSSPTSPPVVAATTPAPELPGGLRKSPMSSVLIMEELETGEKGESGSSPASEAGPYAPFQDQQVKLRVTDGPAALNEAVTLATASGGQLITYPIKGFENMGPHERTLVFSFSNYRGFLRKIQSLGQVEHPEVIRSDFVTVRLTVLEEKPAITPVS